MAKSLFVDSGTWQYPNSGFNSLEGSPYLHCWKRKSQTGMDPGEIVISAAAADVNHSFTGRIPSADGDGRLISSPSHRLREDITALTYRNPNRDSRVQGVCYIISLQMSNWARANCHY
jgi:hypothetical protein